MSAALVAAGCGPGVAFAAQAAPPAHAYLPPSSAAAWVACAMWPTMNARFPDAGGEEAAEGTAAHWVNVECRAGREPAEGTRAPNGVAVTDEMLDGADVWMRATGPLQPNDHTEQRVGYAPGALNWGTPDLWRYVPAVAALPHTLHVFDAKFGHGYVPAWENWQLINYAKLVTDELGFDGLAEQHTAVHLHIVQPRNYHRDGPIRTWSPGSLAHLRSYWNILEAAQTAALKPEPIATPGKHCEHCPGRHACGAVRDAALSAADYAGHTPPLELTPDELGAELRVLDRAAALLEARRTGLQEQALGLIRSGVSVRHYMVESGQSRERWTAAPEVVAATADQFGVNVRKPALLTPAQARKAGFDPSLVAAFSERPPGAVRLVVDDGTAARRAFGATTT